MRAAPAVDALLDDGRKARWLIVALHLGAMAALLAWAVAWLLLGDAGSWLAGFASPAWMPGVVCMLLAAGLGGWQAARVLPPQLQRLRWDGQTWQWLVDDQARPLATVAVQIDLGPHLLLRLQPAPPSRRGCWAVASARAAGQDWHGLRVALQSHAGISSASGLPTDGSAARR